MQHLVDKISEQAADQLEPGEEVVAAVPVTALGYHLATEKSVDNSDAWFAGNPLRTSGWIDGKVDQISTKFESRHQTEEFADLPPADITFGSHGAIVVATDRRVLVFDRSLTGKPIGLLGAWPRAGVRAETTHHRLPDGERLDILRVALADHTVVGGECDQVAHAHQANELVEQLNQAA